MPVYFSVHFIGILLHTKWLSRFDLRQVFVPKKHTNTTTRSLLKLLSERFVDQYVKSVTNHTPCLPCALTHNKTTHRGPSHLYHRLFSSQPSSSRLDPPLFMTVIAPVRSKSTPAKMTILWISMRSRIARTSHIFIIAIHVPSVLC